MNGRRLLVALFAAVLTIGLARPAQAQTKAKANPAKAAQVEPAPAKAASAWPKDTAAKARATAEAKAKAAMAKAMPAKKGKETKVAPKQAEDRKPAARKVVRLEEMRVEGRVQKPQAMFLMPRAGVNPGDEDRVESFLPKAGDAVNRDPF